MEEIRLIDANEQIRILKCIQKTAEEKGRKIVFDIDEVIALLEGARTIDITDL